MAGQRVGRGASGSAAGPAGCLAGWRRASQRARWRPGWRASRRLGRGRPVDARGGSIELEFDPSTGTPAPHFKIIDFLLQNIRFLKISKIARQETQIQFGR